MAISKIRLPGKAPEQTFRAEHGPARMLPMSRVYSCVAAVFAFSSGQERPRTKQQLGAVRLQGPGHQACDVPFC